MKRNPLNRKAVALLSGGLDSHLAIRLMQMQGIEVEAVNFKSTFSCCKDDANAVSRLLGVKLTLLSLDEEYLQLIRKPKFGWGRGVNPCEDCRIYMFKIARKFMDQVGASFVISGEVVGQRPKSQMKHQMTNIEKEAGLHDLLLRPLSAKLMPPTLPEREGIVDRGKLYDIEGRSRHRLHDLARELGITEIPQPSIGCILTDVNYAERVKDHLAHSPDQGFWDFESFKVGRHYRLDDTHKAIVGKNQTENETLKYLHGERPETTLFSPENFVKGPAAILIGTPDQRWKESVGGLILSHSRDIGGLTPRIRFHNSRETGTFEARAAGQEAFEEQLLHA